MNLVLAGFDQIKRFRRRSANVDPNACNNPTFKKGDSPTNNQLAVTALQPAARDKQCPNQHDRNRRKKPPLPSPETGNRGSATGAATGKRDRGSP
jgi:phosphate transport system substrate-binding protein